MDQLPEPIAAEVPSTNALGAARRALRPEMRLRRKAQGEKRCFEREKGVEVRFRIMGGVERFPDISRFLFAFWS